MTLRARLFLIAGISAAWSVAVPAAAAAQVLLNADTTAIVGPPPPIAPAVVSRDVEGRVTMRAIRIDQPLQLDGYLEETTYRGTASVSGFVQQEPQEGEAATEQTEVWVLFDDQNLYVSARMWDSHPERIVANEMRRDNRNIGQNDSFSVALDTFYDRRSGFYFQTNSIGGIREALIADERSANNFDWNTVWDARSRLFDRGWTTEMVIPFKSLRYHQSREQIWSINFRRTVRWKNETSFLTPVPASYGPAGGTRFSVAATLVGVEVPATSRNLELKPYAISQLVTNRDAVPPLSNDLDGNFGFDAKYGLTRSLILDVSYNTDFAQVEEDEQQVNLTRFSQFFPERREFFLEGQGIFEFASVRTRGGGGGGGGSGGGGGGGGGGEGANQGAPNETPLLFFSRRIGLQDGETMPIDAGGRLTGRVGKYSVGLLTMQTDETRAAGAPATNFSVVRVKRDVLRRSSMGVIATRRSPGIGAADSNLAAGIDASFGFFENLNLGGYYARTRTAGREGDEGSYRGQFEYAGDRYGLQYELLKVGEDFNPEIGFMRRENFRRNYGQLRFSPRPQRLRGVRKLYYEGSIDYIVNNDDGRLQSRIAQGTFRADLDNGDVVEASYNRNYEAFAVPFEIAEDIFVPPGGYGFHEVDALYRLGTQRRFAGDLRLIRGQFYTGLRTEASYTGRVELTPRLSLEPRVSITSADLREGSFVTRLVTSRASYTLTPRMFASALVQYSTSTNSVSSNVRFRWEYQPGSDLFVVYTEGRETQRVARSSLQHRGFVVKLTRLWRF
jgi:hypothetical protein